MELILFCIFIFIGWVVKQQWRKRSGSGHGSVFCGPQLVPLHIYGVDEIWAKHNLLLRMHGDVGVLFLCDWCDTSCCAPSSMEFILIAIECRRSCLLLRSWQSDWAEDIGNWVRLAKGQQGNRSTNGSWRLGRYIGSFSSRSCPTV